MIPTYTANTLKNRKIVRLAEQVKQIWKQNEVSIIPLIISNTGMLNKTFIEKLKLVNINKKIYGNIQKAVKTKACNIVMSFLNAY